MPGGLSIAFPVREKKKVSDVWINARCWRRIHQKLRTRTTHNCSIQWSPDKQWQPRKATSAMIRSDNMQEHMINNSFKMVETSWKLPFPPFGTSQLLEFLHFCGLLQNLLLGRLLLVLVLQQLWSFRHGRIGWRLRGHRDRALLNPTVDDVLPACQPFHPWKRALNLHFRWN